MVNSKNYLTIMEVIVVIIIVAILSALTLPVFQKTIQKSREKLAVANLKLIVNAEKLYRARYDSYAACEDLDAINNNLTLDIEGKYFDYKVTTSGKYDFTASAIGKKAEGEYTIDPEGNVSYP